MSKNTAHVVVDFRTSEAHCKHCGERYRLELPARVTVLVAALEAFTKAHRNCVGTTIYASEHGQYLTTDGGSDREDAEAPQCGESESVRPGHDVMATFTDGRDAEMLRVTGSPRLNGIFASGSAEFIVESMVFDVHAPFRVRAMTLRPIERVFAWEKEAKKLPPVYTNLRLRKG